MIRIYAIFIFHRAWTMLLVARLGLDSCILLALFVSWAGHQVPVSLPTNQFLNAGVDPKEIPLPREFFLNQDCLLQLF